MPADLVLAAVLVVVAAGAALWLRGGRRQRVEAEQPWREVAIGTHLEHRRLRRAVTDALATPGAVNGPARGRLTDALGTPPLIPEQRRPEQRRPADTPFQPLEQPVTVIHQVGPGYLSGPESRTGTDVRL